MEGRSQSRWIRARHRRYGSRVGDSQRNGESPDASKRLYNQPPPCSRELSPLARTRTAQYIMAVDTEVEYRRLGDDQGRGTERIATASWNQRLKLKTDCRPCCRTEIQDPERAPGPTCSDRPHYCLHGHDASIRQWTTSGTFDFEDQKPCRLLYKV